MFKLKNLVLAVIVLVCIAIPAFADSGCKNGKFVGSYTHTQILNDVWGDSTGVNHTVLYQLNLQSDGTAFQYWTALPDLMINGGTGTPWVGSWKCRNDGRLVVTLISAGFAPTLDTHGNPSPIDLILVQHLRTTYLFTVDENTLTRTKTRVRQYSVTEDPADPGGGVLRPLSTATAVYKRVVASDADLLAP